MSDEGASTGADHESHAVVALSDVRRAKTPRPVGFERRELETILRLYGRMVAANEWRDYAIDHTPDFAAFSVYRRASESPLFQIFKNPSLARKQGAWSVVASGGQILKRGHELANVLTVFDKKLRLIEN